MITLVTILCMDKNGTITDSEENTKMTTMKKPAKPWRVLLTGPSLHGEADFDTEEKARLFAQAATGDEDDIITKALVGQWTDGRWNYPDPTPDTLCTCIGGPEDDAGTLLHASYCVTRLT